MTINLTYRDLKKIALDGQVTRDGVTIKIDRPMLAHLKTDPHNVGGEVHWHLDGADPGAEAAYNEPM